MLYTSLTSAAGFMSLALTPIPRTGFRCVCGGGDHGRVAVDHNVRAGIYHGSSQRAFANFGFVVKQEQKASPLSRLLVRIGRFSFRQAKPLIVLFGVLLVISVWGITKIRINDNPVKWFAESHPIRKADTSLNKHFKGTYPAYLILEGEKIRLSPMKNNMKSVVGLRLFLEM